MIQADQLFDPATGEFLCTFCSTPVEEDEAAMPRQDSRMMLARFNEVMEQLFVLLREVEGEWRDLAAAQPPRRPLLKRIGGLQSLYIPCALRSASAFSVLECSLYMRVIHNHIQYLVTSEYECHGPTRITP